MLDQEDDPEFYDEWLTTYEQLTRFSKAREQIVGRVKYKSSNMFKDPNLLRKN